MLIVHDSKLTLISLIGKGRLRKNEKGYEKADYFFEKTQEMISTSFFGSALYKTLITQCYEIDKWLIFGTKQSNWSDLINAVDEKYHNKLLDIYVNVYDEEGNGISGELLGEWEKALRYYMQGIRLIIVDPLDYEVYINHMLKEISDEKTKIVLDITHAFRHMPVIIAFSLMVLKYIKNISNIIVYYGALDMKRFMNNDYVPVLKIDFINTLVSYVENLATFNNSAYFVDLLDLLGISETGQTYFWLEMNRQPKSQLIEITQKLSDISMEEGYTANIAGYINRELQPLIGATLDRRMVERAKFFFNKKQYLKALILLYEALILEIGRKHGFSNSLDYSQRKKIRKYIDENKKNSRIIFKTKEQRKIYEDLEYTRNAAVHGSACRGTQDNVEHLQNFERLFNQGLELYENIIKCS